MNFNGPRKLSAKSDSLWLAAVFMFTSMACWLAVTLEPGLAFLAFYPAMIAGFSLGGLGVGSAMAALGALGQYLLLTTFGDGGLSSSGGFGLAVFLFSASLLGWSFKRFQVAESPSQAQRGQLRIDHSLLPGLSERQRAQASARETEARFQLMANAAPVLIWIADANKLCVWFNQAWLDFTGRSLRQEQGNGWSEVVHPDDVKRCLDIYHGHFDRRQPFIMEYRLLRRDGEYRWLHDHGVPLFAADGAFEGYIGSCVDITEMRQTHERLLFNHELFVKLSRQVPGVIYQFKLLPDGRCCFPFASDGIREIYEVAPEQVRDDAALVLARLHADDYEMIMASIQDSARGLRPWHLRYRVQLPGKGLRWLSGHARPERLTDGSVLWHGFITDVSERQLIDEQLEALLRDQKAMLENELVGIAKIKDRKITWVNKFLVRIFGYSKEEFIGSSTRMVYPDDQSYQTFGEAAYPVLNAGGIYGARMEYVRKDGGRIWLDMSGNMLNFASGESLWVFIDVTDSRKADAELRIAATAFESQEGIFVTDAKRLILKVNKAFSRITGYAGEDVLGKNPSLFNSGLHDASFYSAMWEGIRQTGAWQGEIWDKRKNGEIFPGHLLITAVKDSDGKVSNYVATITDITSVKQAADEIRALAFYDPLTHLPNRRLLLDRLKQAMLASVRGGWRGALLYLDLDHFKNLNDTLGHDVGDLLLQQVAKRLVACVREGDTVARLGGDEFVVLLEGLSAHADEAASQAEIVGKKILSALNQGYQFLTHEYCGSISIGVALFSDHQQSQEEVLKQADIAMYQAKKAGRNALCFFDPKMQASINTRVALESALRKAVDQRCLFLYYQIQVDNTKRPVGAEALLRWRHLEHGLVPPKEFVLLAEESSLIFSLGQWVLEAACDQLDKWRHNQLTRALVLSVNVSAKQFRQQDFAARVKAALTKHGANPSLLKLELTESILLENIEATIATMTSLQAIGVQFALDDFGTGYSSLQYLRRLPLNQLKIDQSFVHDITADPSDRTLVFTIIAMAKSLHLEVIAEGVETEQQRQLLLANGCQFFQGYLFGKPLPLAEFERSLDHAGARLPSV